MLERLSDSYSDRDFPESIDGSRDRVLSADDGRLVIHVYEKNELVGGGSFVVQSFNRFDNEESLKRFPPVNHCINILSTKNYHFGNATISFKVYEPTEQDISYPFRVDKNKVTRLSIVFNVDEDEINRTSLYKVTYSLNPIRRYSSYEWEALRLSGHWIRNNSPQPSQPVPKPSQPTTEQTYAPSDIYRESSKHLPEFLPYPNYFKVVYIMKVDERYKDDDYQFIQDTNNI